MQKATEFEQRILSILEEFSYENIFALLNTIAEPTGLSMDRERFTDALKNLNTQGHVEVRLEGLAQRSPTIMPREEAAALTNQLSDWFVFDAAARMWTLSKGDMKTAIIPVVYVTAAGMNEAKNILENRGYRWWSPKG